MIVYFVRAENMRIINVLFVLGLFSQMGCGLLSPKSSGKPDVVDDVISSRQGEDTNTSPKNSTPTKTKDAVDNSQTSDDKRKNSNDKPKNPDHKKKNPNDKSKNPGDKQKNPDDKSENPDDKPKNPDDKPKNPVDKPKNPDDKPKNLDDKPKNPDDEPKEPVGKPKAPVIDLKTPAVKPKEPVSEPKVPMVKPEVPDDKLKKAAPSADKVADAATTKIVNPRDAQLTLPTKWPLTSTKDRVVWIKSIQQYNGWMCGWMALFNASEIVDKILRERVLSVDEFITKVVAHPNNTVDERYGHFVEFQRAHAGKVYNAKTLGACGANLGYAQQKSFSGEKIFVLADCLVDKNATEDQYLRLSDQSLQNVVAKLNFAHPIFIYRHGDAQEEQNNRDALMGAGMRGDDLEDALIDFKPALLTKTATLPDDQIDKTLKSTTGNCLVIALFEGHIFLMIKVVLADKTPIVVIMNSENEHDDSFKAEKTGKVIARLSRALLN